jgi:hypothetical protein
LEVVDVSLGGILLELLVQVLLVDNDIFFGGLVLLEALLKAVGVGHILDVERSLLIFLKRDLVK